MFSQIISFIGYILVGLIAYYIIYLFIFVYKNTNSIRVGYFLAVRSIKRSNKMMTLAIISVMTATFLALIVVSGVMSGLIEGSVISFREKDLGDLVISPLDNKSVILNASDMIDLIKKDDRVAGYSPRYSGSGSIEANWKTLKSNDVANKRNVSFYGIDPVLEDSVTKLSANVKEGSWLTKEDASKYVLLGKEMVEKYSVASDIDPTLLRNVDPGAKVRIVVGSTTNEYIVKGIIVVKNQDIGQKVFFVDSELQRLENILPQNVNMIAVKLKPNVDPKSVKATLIANGFNNYAKIQTFEEGTPAFVNQMKQLFGIMGTMFGSIGIVVSAITLFIVIFINAITRRKQIGILKGIGINSFAIEFSYLFQAILYTAIGCIIGSLIVFLLIKPAIDAHPIDFPFSDGILVVDPVTTLIRVGIFMFIAMIAGYFPARMIVKRNTLDAILGR
ncbi:MAG: FtsX-like permease family protein [Candidatus Nomurabacteria bacterium]